MVVEVSNLRLFDYYKGFSKFSEQIVQTKLSFLLKLKEKFPKASFIFYDVVGNFGTIDKVLKILESYFEDFEINKEPEQFNSSPVNNVPVVRVDGSLITLEDVKTIGLIEVDSEFEKKCDYGECFYILKDMKEDKLSTNEVALKVELTPKDTLESNILFKLESNIEKFLALKLLRGEDVCL